MGEFKGTPGPWHYVVERDNVIKDSKGNSLMCDTSYYPYCPDKDEDWQLIAAAPEMLSALQAVEDWWISKGMKMNNGAPYAIFAVRSAIRKALGEP